MDDLADARRLCEGRQTEAGVTWLVVCYAQPNHIAYSRRKATWDEEVRVFVYHRLYNALHTWYVVDWHQVMADQRVD